MARLPVLLFYCQHSLGIGHLMRSLALARALRRRFRVVLVCGGAWPPGVDVPEGVVCVQLPPMGLTDDRHHASLDAGRSTVEVAAARRAMLLDLLRTHRPRVLVVEYFPFGRFQLAPELLPLLKAARQAGPPRPLVLCSLRDIIGTVQARERVFADMCRSLADTLFDGVLVHADPRFASMGTSFGRPPAVPVYYTGFVVPEGGAAAGAPRAPHVVVSAGGGRVGGPLLRAAVNAFTGEGLGDGVAMTVYTGPFLPDAEWEALRGAARGVPGLRVERWCPDLRGALAGAAASVSQCGYNTAMDLLAAGVPALVVPFAEPGCDEQLVRARKLEALGAVRLLPAEEAGATRLAREVRALVDFEPRPSVLDVNGAAFTADLVASLAGEAVP